VYPVNNYEKYRNEKINNIQGIENIFIKESELVNKLL